MILVVVDLLHKGFIIIRYCKYICVSNKKWLTFFVLFFHFLIIMQCRKRKIDFSEHYKLPCTMINVAPKVVFKIEINEDKVNDGYRWHKYGRKEIKGNANYPR